MQRMNGTVVARLSGGVGAARREPQIAWVNLSGFIQYGAKEREPMFLLLGLVLVSYVRL